jgi:hypothetical protein
VISADTSFGDIPHLGGMSPSLLTRRATLKRNVAGIGIEMASVIVTNQEIDQHRYRALISTDICVAEQSGPMTRHATPVSWMTTL